MKSGCYINSVCVNNLNYADDCVLLAPTPSALQELLNACYHYACNNDMKYNVKKSKCMAFMPKLFRNLNIPRVHLGMDALTWSDNQKYLGVIISNN